MGELYKGNTIGIFTKFDSEWTAEFEISGEKPSTGPHKDMVVPTRNVFYKIRPDTTFYEIYSMLSRQETYSLDVPNDMSIDVDLPEYYKN